MLEIGPMIIIRCHFVCALCCPLMSSYVAAAPASGDPARHGHMVTSGSGPRTAPTISPRTPTQKAVLRKV